ncbi:MAG: hypothetical protein IT379_03630 [Deltaproteobacteria bacterium]|nr:hypothetical protein [Deltaproteobacteria bacterium]
MPARVGARAGWMALAGLAASASVGACVVDASVVVLDAGRSDASSAPDATRARDATTSDGAAPGADAEADARATSDAASDAAPPVVRPDVPTPPAAPIAPRVSWLSGTDATSIAMASPAVDTPEPPRADCAAGWRAVLDADDAAAWCEPWPATGRETCTGATEHFAGEDGCAPIGTACPARGSWAADLPPSATVLHVRAGAPPGGTGSTSAPFASLAEALAAVSPSGSSVVIALAAGTYTGGIDLPAHVTLWGACPGETRIVPSPSGSHVVRTDAAGVALRNLAIVGGDVAVDALAGSAVVLEGVLIEDAVEGIVVHGSVAGDRVVVRAAPTTSNGSAVRVADAGTLTLSRAVLRDVDRGLTLEGVHPVSTLTDVAIGPSRREGVGVIGGAELDANGVVVERSGIAGVFAVDPTAIQLARVVVRDVGGEGVIVLGTGVRFTLEGALVERTRGAAIASSGPMVLTDAVVRDVEPSARGALATEGIGLWISPSSLQRVSVSRVAGPGLVTWEGADVRANDLRIADTGLVSSVQMTGAGIQVTDGAFLIVQRATIERARGAGVAIGGCILGTCVGSPKRFSDGTAHLADVLVASTGASSDGALAGHGILAVANGSASIHRTVVADNPGAQIAVGHESLDLAAFEGLGAVELDDVALRGGTHGALVADGATLTGSRVVVASFGDVGIQVPTPGQVDLRDLVIGDPGPSSSASVVAHDGATASFTRAYVDASSDVAIVADDEDTSVVLTDVTIGGPGDGFGLLVRRGAAASISSLVVQACIRGGIVAAERGSRVTASDVRLIGSPASEASRAGALAVASSGGSISLVRARLEPIAGLGAGAFGPASSLDLADVAVAAVSRGCAATTCAIGLGAYDGASVIATSFELVGGYVGAHLVGERSTLSLRSGLVTGWDVGLALPPGIGVSAVIDEVVLEECATDVATDVDTRPSPPPLP